MAAVLTTQSTIACAHGGTAILSSSAKLLVSGAPVLLTSDSGSWSFDGKCTQTGGQLVPCTNFTGLANAAAGKLTVGGTPVVLSTIAGTTSGKPVATVTATPADQKLVTT